jgi:hypothetical protein
LPEEEYAATKKATEKVRKSEENAREKNDSPHYWLKKQRRKMQHRNCEKPRRLRRRQHKSYERQS